MRVLVCEFHQESNTFNPIIEGLEKFAYGDYEGQPAYEVRKTRPVMVNGMFQAIEEAGGEVIPGIFLHAQSGGRVDDAVLELMIEKTRYYVEQAGEFDAVCMGLHGATCTVSEYDACGVLLKELRKMVGNKPIAAAFDLHANITGKVREYADIICGYQTYPHLDHYGSGYRAAKLCMEMLQGKSVCKAEVSVPMLVPPSGFTNTEEPFKEVMDTGHKLVEDGELLDFTVFVVQPWLDIPEITSTVVAIARDKQVAQKNAEKLAEMLYARRDEYQPDLMSVDEIIDLAEAEDVPKPIILADAADSPNGGCVGDSPVVAMRIWERQSKVRASMFVVDPDAVKKAFEVGIGNSAEFSIGAGFTPGMPGPFQAVGRVHSLHEGTFRLEGPAGRGVPSSMGLCAVVNFGNLDILVSEKCGHSGDPQQFRHFGIEPTMYDLIVVKANTSFKKPYGKFAGQICYADTPGAGAANLKRFDWKNLPKGLYPFDL